jgi:hypothetical protein
VLTEHLAKVSKIVYSPSTNKLYQVSLNVPECLVKNTRYRIDVLSVIELYQIHSVDTDLYRMFDNLHLV